MTQVKAKNIPRRNTKEGFRLSDAFLAGLGGITANTAMLQLAPLLHLHPGSGGVLQLALRFASRWVPSSLAVLHSMGLTKPPSLFGFLWFHYATGLVMIVFYLYVFARHEHGPWMLRSTLFALLIWLINSGIVYPMLGEGFAGTTIIPASGVLYFFVANWMFVAISALVYRTLLSRRLPRS